MNCPEVQELLSAYYDGELDEARSSAVAAHIETCAECKAELDVFAKLTRLTESLDAPAPSDQIWNQIQQHLHDSPTTDQTGKDNHHTTGRRNFFKWGGVTLAAVFLLAVGTGWWFFQSGREVKEHQHNLQQFTAEFGQYLDLFTQDPSAAQQFLLAKYQNQPLQEGQIPEKTGYKPFISKGLPADYRLESAHLFKMPCCTCVQAVCKRNDGSTLAIFEHDNEETSEWFGDRPNVCIACKDRKCCLVEFDQQIAASWKRGSHYITLIGVRDLDEVDRFVTWSNKHQPTATN
ncbi:MAG: zf-HC2 domain-containing protein [Planctomycetaceae bacterium]|nr:zf-HC2 domain-containing protein [Planctomycetaceae bacterium]